MSGLGEMSMEEFLELVNDRNIQKVRKVLDAGFDVNQKDDVDGQTPLIYASAVDNVEMVTLLLDRGADVNATTSFGHTALIIATMEGFTSIVNELCLHSADVNIYNNEGRGALYIAAGRGYLAIVKKLILRGADIDAQDSSNMTPLMAAATSNHESVVTELCESDADVNLAANSGVTALMLACDINNIAMVRELCNFNADVNAQNDEGSTSLLFSCREGYAYLVDILLDYGADPNINSNTGLSPVMGGAYSNNPHIIRALVAKNANVNNANHAGATALMLASLNGRFEAVKALCEGGADATMKLPNGKTAIDMAKTAEIRAYLLKSIEKWKGLTQSDIGKLDTIFEENAINYSTCPVCLEYVERSEACMYMKHDCSKGPYYHSRLYEKYKSDGLICWCTICSRISHGHRHYKLSNEGGEKPDLEKAGDPFARDCTSQGGGGLEEKLSRFRRLREYALELEDDVDKKIKTEAMNELVEEVWNAPLRREKKLLGRIRNEKKWNIGSEKFRANKVNTNANAPNIPFTGELPEKKTGRNNVMINDDVPVLVYSHKQRNGSIEKHGVGEETLEGFLKAAVKEFGLASFGYCFMHPGCDSVLHPEEIKGHVPDDLYNDYRKKFNRKFAVQAGGGGIFREAKDAVCSFPKKRSGTKKGGGKRKVRRTRRV
jgi:ankyrin repeat protein